MKTNSQLLALFLAGTAVFFYTCTKKDSPSSTLDLTCHISSPSNGDTVYIGNEVVISAETNLSSDQIEEVRFYIDNVGISSSSAFPYKSIWNTTGTSPGSHILKAVAFDDSQNTSEDEITVILTQAGPQGTVPSVETGEVSFVTDSSALVGGNVTSDGGMTVTLKGICAGFSHNPDTSSVINVSGGSGTGDFQMNLTGLSMDTLYYARAYAVNEKGIAYGNEVSFHTNPVIAIDYDGNIYHGVKIGNQEWLKENLRVTHYRNGDEIPNISSIIDWKTILTGWAYYDNNANNDPAYGKLYTFNTIADHRNICPEGWHIPSADEWNVLLEYLGGVDSAGGKMKEKGLEHWQDENVGATNESGFTALPGGFRDSDGNFDKLGIIGAWWSSDQSTINPDNTTYIFIYNSLALAKIEEITMTYGLSVRCIRDK